MRLTSILAVTVLLVAVATAPAQFKKKEKDDGTRTLTGQVLDPGDAPLEKAVVYLKNKGNLQVRTYNTREDGAFHFSGLNPNIDYEVWAVHEGGQSAARTLSSFDGRKQVSLNLKIERKK